jgi:UDP-glucose 4-epimerase
MTILITGATGFLGTNLLSKLATRNEKIVVISRFNSKKRFSDSDSITWLEADLIKPLEFDSELNDVDSVIHLAGKTYSEKRTNSEYYYSNEMTTFNLLEKVAMSSCKFIYASSQWVYGNPESLEVSEDFPLQPAINGYACSKINAENWIKRYQELFGGNFISLRYSGFIEGGGLVDYVIDQAINSAPIQLYSYGKLIRDYLTVEDGITALIRALDVPLSDGFYPINIGSGAKICAREITNLIVETLGSKSEIQELEADGPLGNFVMNTSVAEKELNFKARDLREQIEKYAMSKFDSRIRSVKNA